MQSEKEINIPVDMAVRKLEYSCPLGTHYLYENDLVQPTTYLGHASLADLVVYYKPIDCFY
jgi:hypothetical protein